MPQDQAPPVTESGADISNCGKYRYRLWRLWDESAPVANFIMLNPSTADADLDDPTIRKCMGFARKWGHGGIVVTNLFAFRTVSPKILRWAARAGTNIIGENNNTFLHAEALAAGVVVAAWGNDGYAVGRDESVKHLLSGITMKRIGRLTKQGRPRHPLYLPYTEALENL